jgi:hypothetical protein
MAQVMMFLEPPEILRVLTMPLCKDWRQSYSSHQDLWRVLCLCDPFRANVGDVPDDESSDGAFVSLNYDEPVIFGKYRLMYTSFIRCIKYLKRIKEDTRLGRQPSIVDHSDSGFPHFGVSKGLKKFLGRTKGSILNGANGVAVSTPIGVSDDGYSTDEGGKKVCSLEFERQMQTSFSVDSHTSVLPCSTHSDLQLSLAQFRRRRSTASL